MTYKTFRVTINGTSFTDFKATNIDNLRRQLMQSSLPVWGNLKVYSSTGRYLGKLSRGVADDLWTTPKGKIHVLFKDGTLGGEYRWFTMSNVRFPVRISIIAI